MGRREYRKQKNKKPKTNNNTKADETLQIKQQMVKQQTITFLRSGGTATTFYPPNISPPTPKSPKAPPLPTSSSPSASLSSSVTVRLCYSSRMPACSVPTRPCSRDVPSSPLSPGNRPVPSPPPGRRRKHVFLLFFPAVVILFL